MTPTMARDGMRYWRLRPDARLRPWVPCYWLVEPDPGQPLTTRASGAQQLLIPDGHSEIVFNLGGSFARWRVDASAQRPVMRSSYVIGGRTHSVLTSNVEPVRLAGVKLDPRALRALLNVPLGEFRDATLTLTELGCRALLDLEDSLATAVTVDDVGRKLDAFLLQRLPTDAARASAIGPLVDRIRASRGALSILQWARAHTLDARTLERRFVASMGMTPKQFARVLRFKHSYHQLSTADAGAPCAHLESYYDAAHFNRDFRHFLGTSPRQWMKQSAGFQTSVADHLLAGELGSHPLR